MKLKTYTPNYPLGEQKWVTAVLVTEELVVVQDTKTKEAFSLLPSNNLVPAIKGGRYTIKFTYGGPSGPFWRIVKALKEDPKRIN